MTTPHNNNNSPIFIPHHGTPNFITQIIIVLLSSQIICSPAHSQPSPPGSDMFGNQQSFSPLMGVIIIVLIAALFFMGFFSIYIRHCSDNTSSGGTVRRRVQAGSIARSRRATRGLDPAVIESFPTFDYAAVKTAQIGKGALECAVCLTEFDDEDTLRLIPICDHVFHPDCIDQWLAGHTTCPVCRANLIQPGELNSPLGSGPRSDTVLEFSEEVNSNSSSNNDNEDGNDVEESESMEQPLHGRMRRSRSMMRNLSIGRPRWMGNFTRSLTTGHMAVKQWENVERFTLRVPDEVREQIMSGRLERSTSLVVLPRETSSRRGYRMGVYGAESSRGQSGSVRSWVFSMAPPFISRVPSLKSPKVTADMSVSRGSSIRGSIRDSSLHGSIRLPI